jgi:hypothetical protein
METCKNVRHLYQAVVIKCGAYNNQLASNYNQPDFLSGLTGQTFLMGKHFRDA